MVYINSKNIFPCYLPPEPDELFTCWLTRLAINHNVKPYTFIKNYLTDYERIFNRDNDLFIIDSLNDEFMSHIILEERNFKQLFLKSYEGIVLENANQYTCDPNFLPLGIFNKKRKRKGTMYCPSCLRKDIPYYRKQWRLIYSIVCLECKVLLKDCCDNCDSPIEFHNLTRHNSNIIGSFISNTVQLKYCDCGHDLSIKSKNDLKPTSIELEYQRFINNTIKNGYNKFTYYSFYFFPVLRTLAYKYLSPSKRNDFRKALMKFNKLETLQFHKKDFNLIPLTDRKLALIEVYKLMKSKHFESFFYENSISRTTFYNYKDLPYWFIKLI